MSNTFLRIAVTGVTGRMGKEIIKFLLNKEGRFQKNIILGAAITRLDSDIRGMDIGAFMNTHVLGVLITDNIELVGDDFDVLVDFTAPDISIKYLKFCTENNKNIVIGTTGFNAMHKQLITDASKKIGIVFSPNFSVGIALILKILRNVTRVMGNISDINIIEIHHNKKCDIPSGTALMMQNVIINTLQSVCSKNSNLSSYYSNTVKTCVSSSTYSNISVPIFSIRSGDVVGEHTILFAGLGERLEITHKVSDRAIFAYGALCSAIWLGREKIGLFDVSDILDVDTLSE